MDTVSFVNMADGSREEYEFLDREWKAHMDGQATRNALEMLGKLKGPTLGYKIDRYQHSLQSATRALRAEESEVVVAFDEDANAWLSARRILSSFTSVCERASKCRNTFLQKKNLTFKRC